MCGQPADGLAVAQHCGVEVLRGGIGLQAHAVRHGHRDVAMPEHLPDNLVLPGVAAQEIPGGEVPHQMHVEPHPDRPRNGLRQSGLAREAAPPPAMHPNIAHLYHDEVARLSEALQGPNGAEAREAARELIEQVIISPPEHDDDPPRIEVVGELVAMLKAAELGTTPQKNQVQNNEVLHLFASSVKVGSGGNAA